jgi:hypothetical protein
MGHTNPNTGNDDSFHHSTKHEPALLALRVSGGLYLLAHGLGTRGLIDLADGDLVAARTSLEEGLTLMRTLRDARSTALIAATTADIAGCQGDYARAAEL